MGNRNTGDKRSSKSYGLPSPEILAFDDMFRVNLYRRQIVEGQEDYGNAFIKHGQSIGEASEKHRRNIGNSLERI